MIKIRDNFIVLGTSHVSKQSQDQIIETIEKYSPAVVAIELDIDRLKSLLSKEKKKPKLITMIREFGFSGTIFALIAGTLQKNIGQKLGIEPGADMKTAYRVAKENKIPTALVDVNIKYTLKKISNISLFKKTKLLFKFLFSSMDKKTAKELDFNVKKGVPDEKTILKIFEVVKKNFPQMYDILIEDRNKHMVQRLINISKDHENKLILAIVGAGHVDGMIKLIEKELDERKKVSKLEKVKGDKKVENKE